MAIYTKSSGVIERIVKPYFKNTSQLPVESIHAKDGGAWKQVFPGPEVLIYDADYLSNGELLDLAGNGHDGLFNQGPGTTPATITTIDGITALDFKGLNDSGYIAIRKKNYVSGPTDQIDELVIAAWLFILPERHAISIAEEQIFISFDRSSVFRFGLGIQGAGYSGQLSLGFTSDIIHDIQTSHPSIVNAGWSCVGVTFRSINVANSGLRFFLNGVKIHEDLTAYSPISSSTAVETPRYGFVGCGSESTVENGTIGPGTCMNGYLSTMLFGDNHSFTDAEMLTYYDNTKAKYAQKWDNRISDTNLLTHLDARDYDDVTGDPIWIDVNGTQFILQGTSAFPSYSTEDQGSFRISDPATMFGLLGSGVYDFSANQITIDVWFKTKSNTVAGLYPGIIEIWDSVNGSASESHAIAIDPDGTVRLWLTSATNVRSTTITFSEALFNDGAVHNLVLRYDGTTLQAFHNYDQTISTSYTETIALKSCDRITVLGRGTAIVENGFDLQATRLSVYNKALTDDERLQNFNATKARYGTEFTL